MDSPIVVDKPPEYYDKKHDKGFPFEEEGEDGAWSDLASRHPDIAARLRARPPTWGRKRRGDTQNPDQYDDVSGSWGEHFNRFPFGDIPTEFREHFPSHWGERFGPQEHNPQQAEGRSPQRNQQFAESSSRQPPPAQPQPQPEQQPQKSQTIATQTEDFPIGETTENTNTTETVTAPSVGLAQHGLRNTVDLGQKSPADPLLLDEDSSRNQRSMSAPPDNRVPNQNNMGNIAGGASQPQQQDQHSNTEPPGHGNVRHIPIFVEGRDAPVINKNTEQAGSFGETFQPPPPQPEREQFFAEREVPLNFHQPPHFGRNFGAPFSKGFAKQGAPHFAQQKGFPQSQFSQQHPAPQTHARSNSPKPTPTQHTQSAPPQPSQAPPPQPQAPPANDPITKILNIQKDVLDLMTEVENFTGVKQDKRYIYLDEMLTRNLIKLDDIETEGKENIRMARKEAIKCIQKCINVLEAKAEGNANSGNKEDTEMKDEDVSTEVKSENQNGLTADETKEVEPSAAQDQPEIEKEQSTESPKKKAGVKKGLKKREKSKDKADASQDKEESNTSVDEKGDSPVEQ